MIAEEPPHILAPDEPLVGVLIDRVEVAANGIVVPVPAARRSGGAALGGEDHLAGVFGVYGVVVPMIVVDPDHVEVVVDRRLVGVVRDGAGDPAGRVEPADRFDHPAADPPPRIGRLLRFLVADRPEEDRGTVPVALDQHFKLFQPFFGGFEPARFRHHDQTRLVKGVHRLGRMGIMRTAVTVRAHLLDEPDLVFADIVGDRLARQPEVLVRADAVDEGLFPVDGKAGFGGEGVIAEAELGFVDVGQRPADVDL